MLDYIQGGRAFGSVAERLLAANMSPNVLRPYIAENGNAYITANQGGTPTPVQVSNALLQIDEWKYIDRVVIDVQEERLIGVNDLRSRGLTLTIPNGLGKTVFQSQKMSDINDARIDMDAETREREDRYELGTDTLPLPIIHADFRVNMRYLEESRQTGAGFDTTMITKSTRKVAEKLETILFTGTSSFAYGGGTIYGYMDFPYRNTVTLTAHWNDSAATGETMLVDLLAMKQAAIDAGFYGPYMVYIPTNFETAIDGDFKANSDKSIRSRLLEVGNVMDIKVADMLTDDNIILVQLTEDVVRMIEGMALQPLQWDERGGIVTKFKVMTIAVPQIRADYNNACGIVHGSK
jgi:uncharacterized linocin/CFP29 family protein